MQKKTKKKSIKGGREEINFTKNETHKKERFRKNRSNS